MDINKLDYSEAWYKLLSCPDAQKWTNFSSLCELAFSLPFLNGRVKQIFSSMKIIKTDHRTNLQADTMNDLLEIYVEGPPFSSYCADRAVELWWNDCSTTRESTRCCQEKSTGPKQTQHLKMITGKVTHHLLLSTSLEDWDECFCPDVVTVDDDDDDI